MHTAVDLQFCGANGNKFWVKAGEPVELVSVDKCDGLLRQSVREATERQHRDVVVVNLRGMHRMLDRHMVKH